MSSFKVRRCLKAATSISNADAAKIEARAAAYGTGDEAADYASALDDMISEMDERIFAIQKAANDEREKTGDDQGDTPQVKPTKIDLKGKKPGDVLVMDNGSLYRIEGIDGKTGRLRTTRNPDQLSERSVLLGQDEYDRIFADDQSTRQQAQAVAAFKEQEQGTADLDAMFDDVLAEEVAKDEAAKEPPKPERVANAKRAQAGPRAMTNEGRAVDGMPINGGDVFSTSSGRTTTPYPKQKSERYATQWLIDNAVAEAEARGDDFNARGFKAETVDKSGSMPPASIAAMQEYLFGEQPAVVPSILKPLNSAATNTAKGLTNAIDGLGALFGGAGRLGSGPSFDEDTYAKAKPLFLEAVKNVKDAGNDIKELMRAVIRLVLDKFGAQAAQNMKPYAVRFVSDVQAGNINLQGDDNASTLQADGVPTGSGSQTQTSVSAGQGNSQPMDAGVAGDGAATGGDGRVPAGAASAGGSGAGRAGTGADNAPGAARNNPGVGSEPGATDSKPADFDLTGEDIGTGGLTRKYKDNIAAIRILKAMESEGRVATPDERKQLARYVGWGALKAAFDQANTKWSKQYEELKGLLTDAEYKAARASTLDAHYTSPVAVGAMFNALDRLGFKKGRVLEPSVGSGNFFGLMPKDMRAKSSLFGVELDPLTSKLAQALYPSAKVKNSGFEDFDIPAGYFDVVVGNPPFGRTPIRDAERSPYSGFHVHNYFLAKGIDKLRPGGIMQVVVSHNFLDAQDNRARMWIAERANLIGAVRLPNTAFKENAGTEVVTDILVFRKKGEGANQADIGAWIDPVDQVNVNAKTGENVTHKVSQLFAARPDLVLGTPTAGGSMYSANEYTVEATGDMKAQLDAWVKTLPENVYQSIDRGPERNAADVVVPDGIKVGSYFVDANGAVQQRGEDVLGSRTAQPWAVPTTTRKGVTTESTTAVKRMVGMVELRDTLRAQMRLERLPESTEQEIQANRAKLNQQYDAFLKAYGHLNNQTNRRIFLDDPESQLLQALEFDFDKGVSDAVAEKEGIPARGPSATKADIFSRRVVFPPQDSLTVSSAKDALLASLNFKGGVDLSYMQSVYSKGADEIVAELGDIVFNDPLAGIVMADEYLSGDVKTKLAEAESAAKSNPAMKRNVEALRKIIPADKKPSEITVSIGAAFVPAEVYQEFVKHITGGSASMTYLGATGQWLIDWKGQTDPALNTGKFGTAELSARDLFQMTIMGKGAIVKKILRNPDGSTTTIVLEKETEAARAKQNAIKDEWKAWLWKDADRADAMVSAYNEKMNRLVVRKFDGSHMTFPGMSPAISLLPHQKSGVWRGLQTFQTLYDHVVGAGKTFEMATLAMEMRRLGIARKPVFVVPNHLTLQWRSEFTRLYPTSNVLAATPEDFGKGNREKMFSKIVTGDWDAVIIGHSSLKKIGLPPETEKAILQEQIDEISAAIEEMKRSRGDRNIIGDMERIRKTLDAKMKDKLAAIGQRDKVLTFDELGMDAMFIDEMHEFKNLSYNSTMDRVPGMGNPKGSDKSFDLFVKIRWLFETFGAKTPLITATGTPVSNSLVEMYNMQRFMQYPTMKAMGTHVFDAWARQFGSVESVYEVSPSGTGFRQSNRFAKFTNLPALMAQYNTFADVITLDDLKAQEEGRGKRFPVPKLVGGRPQIVVAERSPQVAEFMGVPRVVENEDGSLKFMADLSQNIDIAQDSKTGKWLVKVGADMLGSFDTEADARLKLVEKALSPVIGVDPNSILGQFGNLKQLTKSSKGKINALSLTGQANKAGLDFRLINPAAPDFPGSKINKAVEKTVELYKKWDADKGAQLIFSDLSVPLSARSSLGAKAVRVYVRGDDGLLTHKRGTLHTLEGFESLPYIITEQGVKESRRFDLFDAATGVKLQGGFKTKAEAKEKANALLTDATQRDKWIAAREAAGDIEQEQIDDYNDINEIDTEETESITREDISGMSGASKFSVYDDIKAKLIARGIPEREIAFIHDYSTPTAKAKLFKAVNSGDIRILLGSTPKMGAGTNVQQRLVGLHHIDAPWRPSDLEQREGRIIRRGNMLYERDPDGFEVAVYRYATSQTYDTRRWQILEHKARGIEQLRNYDGTLNEIDDIAGEAANSADMKAAASGDPLILEETRLRNEVRRLEQLEVAHADNVVSLNRKAQSLQQDADKYLPAQRAMFEDLKATAAKNPVAEDEFPKLNVDGQDVRDKDGAVAAITNMVKTVVEGAKGTQKSMDYRGLTFTLENSGFGVYLYGPDMQGNIGNWAPGEAISPTGLLQRMGNYVGRIQGHIEDIDAKIVQSQKQAVDLREQAKAPFGQTADLARARDDYRGVQRALIAKGPDVPADQKRAVTAALEAQREALRQAGFGDALKEFMGTAAETPANFSRVPPIPNGKGLRAAQTQAAVDAITKNWENGPEIIVVRDMQDMDVPEAVRKYDEQQRSLGADGTPEGFYFKGKVYVVASMMRNANDVARVVFHEALGHFGLQNAFGGSLKPILKQLATIRAAEVKAKAKSYGLDVENQKQLLLAAEEVLAEMAQTRPEIGFVRRAIAAIRTWLRQNVPAFSDMRVSDDEIVRNFILPAREFVERGSKADLDQLAGNLVPAFSRSAMNSVEANIKRGTAAMNKAILEKADANRAMFRPGIGWVDFVWGDGKKGLQHIISRRQQSDGMTVDQATRFLTGKVVDVIATGKELRRTEVGGSVRLALGLEGAEVSLVRRAGSNGWVLTAFELEPDSSARSATQSPDMQNTPIRSRRDLGAGDSILSGEPGVVNSDAEPMLSRGAVDPETAKTRATDTFNDLMATTKTFNGWWHKTVGTQYHKAEKDREFKRVYDATQAYIGDVSKLSNDAADLARDLLPRLDKLGDVFKGGAKDADVKAIGKAIFQGTLGDKRQYEPEELKRVFGLTDTQIKLYQQFRAATNKSLDVLTASTVAKLLQNGGFRKAQFQEAIDAADHRAMVRMVEDVAERDPKARELAEQVREISARADQLQGEGYAPLMRFGQFAVSARDVNDGTLQEFYLFESQFQANRKARELEASGKFRVDRSLMSQEDFKLLGGISPESLELFGDVLAKAGVMDARDEVLDAFIRNAVAQRSAMKRMLERVGYPGYSTDVRRVLAAFITSNARLASKNLHFSDMLGAAESISKSKGDVRDEATKLVTYVQNPEEEAAGVRGLLFVKYIGGSVASALVNMTQSLTMTLPYLSQFSNPVKATATLTNAMAEAAAGVTDPELKKAMAKAEQSGLVSPQEIHHLNAEAMKTLGSQPAIQKTLFVWGSMFGLAEQYNRRVAFIAGWNTAVAKGEKDPYAFAQKAVEETQGVYNKGNRPNWARGAVGATIFTFKQFSISYLEFLNRLPNREKALALAILMLAAGAEGLPFADDLDDVIDTVAQKMGYSFNSKQEKRRFLAGVLGQGGAEFALKGMSAIPGMPIDVAGRMGMANLLPGTGVLREDVRDHMGDVFEFLGPAGGVAKDLISKNIVPTSALDLANNAIAPTAVRNLAQAIDMFQTGKYRDKDGRKVVDVAEADAAMKAIGFQPATVAQDSLQSRMEMQNVNLAKNVEQSIARDWAMAQFEGDAAGVQAARQRLREWNEKNPDQRISINTAQIAQRLRQMRQSRADRIIKSAPKELRPGVREALL